MGTEGREHGDASGTARSLAADPLLLVLAQAGAEATSLEGWLRQALSHLLSRIPAQDAWIGHAHRGGTDVYGPDGRLPPSRRRAVLAAAAAASSPQDFPSPRAGPPASTLHELEHSGPRTTWLLVSWEEGVPPAAEALEDVLRVCAILRVCLRRWDAEARLRGALTRLRRGRRARGAARKASLEARARALEGDQRAVLESERNLLDREREERMDHLAAGVAHHLNNPLGAMSASLEFARSLLDALPSGSALDAKDLEDLRDAVRDADTDARRIRDLARSSFHAAARERRAVMNTEVSLPIADAVDHFGNLEGRRVDVDVVLPTPLQVGVARGELARWIFRLLSTVGLRSTGRITMSAVGGSGGAEIRMRFPGAGAGPLPVALAALGQEVSVAGGSLRSSVNQDALTVCFLLPLAVPGLARGTGRAS